jgi:hypothetical protein
MVKRGRTRQLSDTWRTGHATSEGRNGRRTDRRPGNHTRRGVTQRARAPDTVARARVLRTSRDTMRATVFRGVGQFGVEEVPRPHAGPGDAVIRVTLTTICGTDLHIVRGEYAVRAGLAESAHVRPGDAVVVFAQGPIGLCATAGARLMGASLVIGVDGDDARLAMAKRMGADVVLDYRAVDVAAEVQRLTGGGADIAIEALGTQQTFESALRSLRPAGTLSSLGVYSGKLATRAALQPLVKDADRPCVPVDGPRDLHIEQRCDRDDGEENRCSEHEHPWEHLYQGGEELREKCDHWVLRRRWVTDVIQMMASRPLRMCVQQVEPKAEPHVVRAAM